jgi:bifunctional oligoribonuclease and PAP phosphatase NrnA
MLFNFSLFNNYSKTLLLTHENADMDAICSAAIMQSYFKQKKIDSTIGVPSHINEQASTFISNQKISVIKKPVLDNYDCVIIFDMNDYEQLGPLKKEFISFQKKQKNKIYAFDHHEIEKRSIVCGKNAFINPKAISATQLIYETLGKKSFDKKMCFYVCLGILEDTGHFITGSVSAFKIFSECLEKSGKKYSELLGVVKREINRDEKYALLKAAQRAQIHDVGEVIVTTSVLSFYQGQAATKLLDFGADISLVAGTDKHGITSMSVRADSVFKNLKKFNSMNHLLKPLQKKVGGEIGGHSGAAQWKGVLSPQKILGESIQILEKMFS